MRDICILERKHFRICSIPTVSMNRPSIKMLHTIDDAHITKSKCILERPRPLLNFRRRDKFLLALFLYSQL